MSDEGQTKSRVFLQPLFRESALARRGQAEALDGLLRVTSPHEWAVLAAIAVILAAALFWGVFGSVERSVAARCVFFESGASRAVLSSAEGTVAEVMGDVGDEVGSGEPIARLRLPEMEMQIAAARTRVAILEADQDPAKAVISLARAELEGLQAVLESSQHVLSPSAGTLVWSGLAVGQPVERGEEVALVRDGPGGLQVLAFVDSEDAALISAGMEAQIAHADPSGGDFSPDSGFDGSSRSGSYSRLSPAPDSDVKGLVAMVSEVSASHIPSPDQLARISGFTVPASAVPIVLDLSDPVVSEAEEGDLCRLRITVVRDRPIGLIAQAGSASSLAGSASSRSL